MIDPNMTPEKALYLLGQMGYDQHQVDELIRQRRQQQAYPIGQAPTGAPPTTIGALPPHMVPPPEEQGGIVEGIKKHPLQYGLGMGAGLLTAAATGGPDPSDAVVFPTVTKAVAGALKTLPGRIAVSGGMSALGGWAGRGMENAYRMERNMPRAPRSLMDAYEQQAYAALEEGAADIAGNVAGEGIRAGGNVLRKLPYTRRILAPMAPTVRPGFEGASERLSTAMAKIPKEELSEREYKTLWRRKYLVGPRQPAKIGATIGQQIEAPLLDIGENVASASLFGSKRMRPLKEVLQPKGLNIIFKEASDELWEQGAKGSPAEVGQMFVDAVMNKKEASQNIIRKLYGQVDELTEGMPLVNITSLKEEAQRIAAQAAESRGLGSSQGMSRLAGRVAGLEDSVSFGTAQEIRSNLLEETRKLEGLLGTKMPKVNRVATKMVGQLDELMEQTAKVHSPEAYKAWRTANAATKKLYKDVISNQYIEGAIKIADKRPQDVARFLFKPNAIEPVRAAKKILPKKTWNSLVASYMENMMIPPEGETVMGKSFLKKFNNLGDDVLQEMFSKEQLANIREAGLVARLVQDPIGGRGGGMLIQLTQAGAVVGLATGGLITDSPEAQKGAVILLLGPAALGRIMTNPTGIKWLTRGLTMPNWTPAATAAGIKILKAARGAPDIEGPRVPETLPANTQSGYVDPFEYDPYLHGAPKAPPREKPLIGLPKPGRILPPLFSEDEQQTKQNLLLKTTR